MKPIICFFKGHDFQFISHRMIRLRCGEKTDCFHVWKFDHNVNVWGTHVSPKKTGDFFPVKIKTILRCTHCGEQKETAG